MIELAADTRHEPAAPLVARVHHRHDLFILVFGLLGKMLMPRIIKMLAERTEQIEGGLARSEEAQAEAKALLDQYRQQLEDARRDAARLREEAREQGAQIIAEMREQAQAEARRITESAQAQIEAERQQALTSLRTEVGTLATELASRIVGESLTDEARQSRMVDRFLDDLEAASEAPHRTDGGTRPFGRMTGVGREVMRGASRASFAALTERLAEENISSAAVATRLGNELFAVVGLLDTEHGLRRALSDPGKPAAEKTAVAARAAARQDHQPRPSRWSSAAVESRWATSGNMVDAIEQLAVEAMVLAAEAENGLDDLEDGLFRFGRVVSGQPELRAALVSTSLPAERKEQLLGALLQGKVTGVALRLITQMVTHPRGRAADRGPGHVRRASRPGGGSS